MHSTNSSCGRKARSITGSRTGIVSRLLKAVVLGFTGAVAASVNCAGIDIGATIDDVDVVVRFEDDDDPDNFFEWLQDEIDHRF